MGERRGCCESERRGLRCQRRQWEEELRAERGRGSKPALESSRECDDDAGAKTRASGPSAVGSTTGPEERLSRPRVGPLRRPPWRRDDRACDGRDGRRADRPYRRVAACIERGLLERLELLRSEPSLLRATRAACATPASACRSPSLSPGSARPLAALRHHRAAARRASSATSAISPSVSSSWPSESRSARSPPPRSANSRRLAAACIAPTSQSSPMQEPIAVEVELTPKAPRRLEGIDPRLAPSRVASPRSATTASRARPAARSSGQSQGACRASRSTILEAVPQVTQQQGNSRCRSRRRPLGARLSAPRRPPARLPRSSRRPAAPRLCAGPGPSSACRSPTCSGSPTGSSASSSRLPPSPRSGTAPAVTPKRSSTAARRRARSATPAARCAGRSRVCERARRASATIEDGRLAIGAARRGGVCRVPFGDSAAASTRWSSAPPAPARPSPRRRSPRPTSSPAMAAIVIDPKGDRHLRATLADAAERDRRHLPRLDPHRPHHLQPPRAGRADRDRRQGARRSPVV